MIKPPLTLIHVSTLKQNYERFWHQELRLEYGVTEIWYKSVLHHLEKEGHDLVPSHIRQLEEKIIRRGLAKEYLASLIEITDCDGLEDEAKLLALSIASSEERLEALKKLIDKLNNISLPRYLSLLPK